MLRRYWRIYRTFFVSSFARELEFRANFFAKVLQNFVWIGFFLLIILVIYSNTESVAGWSRGDAFILVATCFLMNAVFSGFFGSLQEIPNQVRQGTLDFVIAKPVDTQFWISTRKFNFDQVGTILAGAALIAAGVSQSQLSPSWEQWLAYFTLVFCSLGIFYGVNLAMMTLGIWLVRVDNLWVLRETIMDVARFPTDIYGGGLQKVFLYALPLSLLATVPSAQLTKGVQPSMLLLGISWAVLLLGASRLFWNFALRHYSSASS